MGKTIAVCSGRGGEGKTTIALSLAVGAARRGKQVILLDASGMARTSDMILGMESIVAIDMTDVASGEVSVHAALYPVSRYQGLSYACASFGNDVCISALSSTILVLQSICDILIVDLPSGIADLGRGVLCEKDTCVIVLRPEEASIRASESLLSRIGREGPKVCCVLNNVNREYQRHHVQMAGEAVQMVLDCPIAAQIPEDRSIPFGTAKGKPAIECDGPAWKLLSRLADELTAG